MVSHRELSSRRRWSYFALSGETEERQPVGGMTSRQCQIWTGPWFHRQSVSFPEADIDGF